jgi:hypothetical protein
MPKSKPKKKSKVIYKSVDQIVCHTSSTTFYKFWKENRRHERALKKIYGQDKLHICQPEEVGSVSQVHPGKRLLVTFYQCSVCMRDIDQKEAKKLMRKQK